MTSDRPYRSALPTEEAVAEIRAGSGTQFDPRCVEAFEVLAAEDEAFVLKDRRLTPTFAVG
jgi:HD-GYP domain-containing protein (c-di-GMP phosphodiesterase class II)